jgi:hypothetical protein
MVAGRSSVPRFFPYPAGNVNGLCLPEAMAMLDSVESQWWFLVGLLYGGGGDAHSFELSVIDSGFLNLAIVDFDFTFDLDGGAVTSGGRSVHVTSLYGGEQSADVKHALFNALASVRASCSNEAFSLEAWSLQPGGPAATMRYNAERRQKQPSMYSGYVGQPGAAYDVKATGHAFLTEYSAKEVSSTVLYAYDVVLTLSDDRGLVSEGWGGYSGEDPLAAAAQGRWVGNVSVEYALPRLRVERWSITLTPASGASGRTFEFGNDEKSTLRSSLWLDRQALHAPPSQGLGQPDTSGFLRKGARMILAAALAKVAKTLESPSEGSVGSAVEGVVTKLVEVVGRGTEGRLLPSLYCGCWLSVTIDHGPYAGVTADFVAFWHPPRPKGDYDTQRGDASGGFMNLYLGILRNPSYDPVSAYTVSDQLVCLRECVRQPYRILFAEPFPEVQGLPDAGRWAKTIQVTIKGDTQARYALAAYAKRANPDAKESVSDDIVLTLRTLSPYTTTTPISQRVAGTIYEGAAVVENDAGVVVGTGWVEQMVG